MLIIRWRRWLTDFYVNHWLGDHAHYPHQPRRRRRQPRTSVSPKTSIASSPAAAGRRHLLLFDPPDLHAVVARFVLDRAVGPVAQLHVPGTETRRSGFLFWVALDLRGFGTLVTHLIGRTLVDCFSCASALKPTSLLLSRDCANMPSRWRFCRAKAEQSALGACSRSVISNYLRSSRRASADGLHLVLRTDIADHPLCLHRAVPISPTRSKPA